MQFNTYAASYDQHAFIQQDLINWALPYFHLSPLQNKHVIELGAGTGLLTQYLAKMSPLSLTATDISQNMINIGSSKIPQALWLPLNAWDRLNKPTDVIASSSLLHWASDPLAVLKKWHQSLSPSGSLHCLFFIDKTLSELKNLNIPCDEIEWRNTSQWLQLFDQAQFNVLLIRDQLNLYSFANPLDLFKTLKLTGTTPKSCLLPGKLLKIMKTYQQDYSTPQGISSSWHFCQIIATKKNV